MSTSEPIHWPAPAGEPHSSDYDLEVNGWPVFVYTARVRAEILEKPGLWSHRLDCAGESAAFALFDISEAATIRLTPTRPFASAAILPAWANIEPHVADGCIQFTIERPQHLTVVLDGSDDRPIHLFAGDPETNAPRPGDPDVIYFGPGAHDIRTLDVESGRTVYLAGGAIVRAVLLPGERGEWNEQWQVAFHSGSVLNVDNAEGVRICGRGILDGSLIPHPGRSLVGINRTRDVKIEGIVLRDSPNWNVVIRQSQDVTVDDLRIVSGRLNSDGINSVNSRHVSIRRCFVRNHDDSIVVKTTEPGIPAEEIRVEDCTVWNDWGYALGVTYETRSGVHDILFQRCDILFARHWSLGIHVSDSATVGDVVFHDIEIADIARASRSAGSYAALTDVPYLLRVIICRDVWGKDTEAGRVRNITLDGVTLYGSEMLPSEIRGLDADHDVRGVSIRNVRLAGGLPILDERALRLVRGEFVSGLRLGGPARSGEPLGPELHLT